MFKVTARLAVLGGIVLMMAGCAGMPRSTEHPSPAVEPGHALVYFFRESSFKGAAIQYDVRDNGAVVGALQSGTYFFEDATPGKHIYSAKTEAGSDVTIDVTAGKTYYVQGTISMGFFAGHPHLKVADAATAQAAIAKLDYAIRSAKAGE